MENPAVKSARWNLFRNRTSYAGMYLAGVGVALILFTAAIDWLHGEHSSYVGLLLLLFMGMVFFGGSLILFGAWRKRSSTAEPVPKEYFNLNEPADRRKFYLFFVGGVCFLNAAVFGTYAGYRYTETDSFCGALCHTMTPEYVSKQSSPHANVECVECHVGPGLTYLLKYKLAGTRQLVDLLANNYPTPIPTPLENLRPARDVCEHCHWPGNFFGTKLMQHPSFRSDKKNTAEQITLGVKIGGRIFHSIHYNHAAGVKQIDYATTEPQEQVIPWVSVTRLDGSTEEYLSLDYKGPDKDFATEARIFDCIGCHNRPTHIFHSPGWAINVSLAANHIPRDLPWIKKVATEALSMEYPDRDQAHTGIQSAILGFYKKKYPKLSQSRKADIDQTATAVVEIYDRNVFPEMKANWKTHPNNLSHKDWPGCFRCHDGRHATQSGKVLNNECTLCHTKPVRGPLQTLGIMSEGAPGAKTSWHPMSLSGKHGEISCNRCHQGGDPPPTTCSECHDIDSKGPMSEQGCQSCHQGSQLQAAKASCRECHDPKGLHIMPTHSKTDCVLCHKPHKWIVTGRETCMQCHDDKKDHHAGIACIPCHVYR